MSILEGMWVGDVADGGNVMVQTESYSTESHSMESERPSSRERLSRERLSRERERPSKEKERSPLPNLTPSEFAAIGKKNVEAFASAQAELFSVLQEVHRRWFDRMQSEAELASEFADTLKNCRSVPDAVAAFQDWTGRRFKMTANDGRHVLADCQKVMQTGARFLTDGLLAKGNNGASAEANGKE